MTCLACKCSPQRSEPQVGGQLVYPTLGAEWEESAELSATIEDALAAANRPGVGYASVSIELGILITVGS